MMEWWYRYRARGFARRASRRLDVWTRGIRKYGALEPDRPVADPSRLATETTRLRVLIQTAKWATRTVGRYHPEAAEHAADELDKLGEAGRRVEKHLDDEDVSLADMAEGITRLVAQAEAASRSLVRCAEPSG